MRVLGVDPSSRRLGLAVLDDERVVKAWGDQLEGDTLPDRLAHVWARVRAAIRKHRPDIVIIEEPGPWTRASVKSSTRTVEVLAMVRGVVMVAATLEGVQSEQLTVNTARHAVCGKGNTKKWKAHQILGLTHTLPLLPNGGIDEDAADALLIALAWVLLERAKGRIQRA